MLEYFQNSFLYFVIKVADRGKFYTVLPKLYVSIFSSRCCLNAEEATEDTKIIFETIHIKLEV